MAFDGFVQEIENETHGPTPEIPEERGMDEFILDPQNSKLFDFYLKAVNKSTGAPRPAEEAWQRYQKSEPNENDIVLIQAQFEEFKNRLARYEKTWADVSKFKNGMLTHSPVFRQFNKFNGTANIARVLEHGLRDMALAEPLEFANVEAEVEKVLSYQRTEAALEEKLKEFSEKHGITDEGRMKKIMANPDQEARQAELTKLLRENLTWGARIYDKITGTFKEVAKELAVENVHQLIQDKRAAMGAAGDYVKSLLVTRDDFRTALARLHNGERVAFPDGSEAIMPLSETRERVKELDKEGAIKEAKAFRQLHKDKDWNDPVIRDALQEEFFELHGERSDMLKKSSFFGRVLMAIAKLFDPRTDKDIKKILDK